MAAVITENQFVTFRIEQELYAVNVFKVREILEVPEITKVPGMPEMIRGVVNIRGSVVPVIDLKEKFGHNRTEYTQDTAIIVLELESGHGVIPVGIIADSAHEVINLESEQIEPPPRMSAFINNEFISGMGKLESGFVIILNIDKLLSDKELSAVSKISDN